MNKTSRYPLIPIKITCTYPEELEGLCPVCDSRVERKYNTSEKIIYTLKGPLCVRYDLMICTNSECNLYEVPFNPSPRFDYSQRY